MEIYSINDVERFTGVKAHTLRIWEKRYKSIIPHRTATKIRYYDELQVKKLLNISCLLDHNYKISYLMKLTDSELNELILEKEKNLATDDLCNIYINDLIKAMIAFDEPFFDKLFSTVITRFGVYEAMIKVIYPFMNTTGILWATNSLVPAQEHFASNIIKRKLNAAIDGIPYPKEGTKKFLLFLPSNEWHEIGLLFSDYVIRNAGHHTIYLGQSLPISNLTSTIENVSPQYLLTFVIPGDNAKDTLDDLYKVAVSYPATTLIICNNVSVIHPVKIPNVVVLTEPGLINNYL